MNIAVFLPNWIGDVVMATPTLRALRKHFGPEATLAGILNPYVADVLEGTPWLNEYWFYDRRAAEPGQRFAAVARRLRRARPEAAVIMPNSFHTALMAWWAGAKNRVGYVRNRRGLFLNVKLQPLRRNRAFVPYPALDYYLQMAYAIGCSTESPKLELATTPADEEAADRAWRELGLRRDGRVVVFNASGAYGEAKLWPEEYFRELAQRVAGELGHDVLVLCGPEERERADRIAGGADTPRVFSLAGQPVSIGLSKACVKRSRLLVTTDSGPRHFAAAFNVPVVSLFGPTHVEWTDTHYERETRLQVQVDCGPCQQRTCPEGHHKCMRDLTVEMVYGVVTRELARTF